jgi:hypothetical protein
MSYRYPIHSSYPYNPAVGLTHTPRETDSSNSSADYWATVFWRSATCLMFTTVGTASLFYLVFSGLSAAMNPTTNFLHASMIMFLTFAASVIIASILYLVQANREWDKLQKKEHFEKRKGALGAMVGIPTVIFELGLLLVGVLFLKQAIACMISISNPANQKMIYLIASASTALEYALGIAILIPVMVLLYYKLQTKKPFALFSIAFLLSAIAGFSFLSSHCDNTFCMMLGLIAIGAGMFSRHISHNAYIRLYLKSSEEGIEQKGLLAVADGSTIGFTLFSMAFLTAAAVCYYKHSTFIQWTESAPSFNTAFFCFMIGTILLSFALVIESLTDKVNVHKYDVLDNSSDNAENSTIDKSHDDFKFSLY